jgi:hypothetical protein
MLCTLPIAALNLGGRAATVAAFLILGDSPDLRRGFFRANFFRHAGWSSRPNRPSADLYELFSKVSALQQPKECFWHVFDPLKHIFFEAELPRSLPIGETL